MKRNSTQLSISDALEKDQVPIKRPNSKMVQTILNFPSASTSKAGKSTTCSMCGMTYYCHVSKDIELHDKYHSNFLNGISWSSTFISKELDSFTIFNEVARTSKNGLGRSTKPMTFQARIITIDKKSLKQKKKVQEVLDMVNQELNAPNESQFWQDEKIESSRAFLIIIDSRIVGICTTDPISNTSEQCRWMIHSSQTIVPNQVNRQIKVGISRIWIAPNWRRLHMSKRLLDCICKHSIYGLTLTRSQIGFSQPSHSGGLLAKNYNGIAHKSGKVLIPVYLEE